MSTADIVFFTLFFILGLIIVVSTSVDIFNQPSYSKSPGKPYTRIKPRFVTLKKKYKRALGAYLMVIGVLYCLITFFPEALSSLGVSQDVYKKIISRPTWPLAAVSFVIGLQSLGFIKQFEKLWRSKLHKWAKIPEGARETIDRLKRAEFNFQLYNNENGSYRPQFDCTTKKRVEEEQPRLERKWFKISCIISNLSRAGGSEPGASDNSRPSIYDADFFQEYEEDYRDIETLHKRLSNTISLYEELKHGTKEDNPGNFQSLKESLEKDLDDLLERVYTFIACAVRSKQSTESEVYAILSRLGFSLPSTREKPIDLDALITFLGFSGILIVLAVFAGSYIFPKLIDPEIMAKADYMKGGAVIAVVWACSILSCHGSSALVALSYRKSQIAKGSWKVPNGAVGRPLCLYLRSALIGGLLGYAFLMVIALIYIALNKTSNITNGRVLADMLLKMGLQNLIWVVAIGSTAWFAVHHYDTYYGESTKRDYISKAGRQAAIMAVIGFMCAMVYTEIWHIHNPRDGFTPQDFMTVRLVFSFFVAGVLSSMGAVMGYWFTRSNHESLFRTIRIDCHYDNLHLPEGAAIYDESGKKVGGNGEWITLFKRRHTLSVECDQLGAAKRSQLFDLDLVNGKSEIVEVAVQPA